MFFGAGFPKLLTMKEAGTVCREKTNRLAPPRMMRFCLATPWFVDSLIAAVDRSLAS
jgi:hypothetical protein